MALLAILAAIWLLTARAGDPLLYPAPPSEGAVRVLVVDHGWHAGVVVNVADLGAATGWDLPLVAALARRFDAYPSIEIGWGDETFYTSAASIGDLESGMAASALFGFNRSTVLHVAGLHRPARDAFASAEIVALDLSRAGFERFLREVEKSFVTGLDGEPTELGVGLYGPSLFYKATGRYSLASTCNHWVAGLLAAAGVPVSPVPSTIAPGLMMELRWRADARPFPAAIASAAQPM